MWPAIQTGQPLMEPWLCHKTGLSNSLLSSLQQPTKASHCCLVTKSCSHSFVTRCTTARQAPLSMAFSRQEYWRGLPCPPLQGIFPIQGSNASLLFGRWILYHPATWQPQSSVSPNSVDVESEVIKWLAQGNTVLLRQDWEKNLNPRILQLCCICWMIRISELSHTMMTTAFIYKW